MDPKYRELSAVLKIITPILGSVIDYDARCGRFQRSPDGDVVLLPGWWQQTLDYGAKAIGRGQSMVRQVRFDSVVRCELSTHRRYTSDDTFIDHEAIERLCVVQFSLPVGLQPETMKEILDQGGRYVGLAPFRWHRNYGRFEVIDIGPEVSA